MIKQANVYVHGSMLSVPTKATFNRELNYRTVNSLDESDIVVWTGGEDIYPGLYGEKSLAGNHFSRERDKSDIRAIEEALKKGKFLVGICRGAQLLNVIPNGGKLWQDVNKHGACIHTVWDTLSKSSIRVNSVHHQALKVTKDAELLAWTTLSTVKESEGLLWKRPKGLEYPGTPEEFDVEVCWYPKTKSLCVQFHPEFGHTETTSYFFELMEKYYWMKEVEPEKTEAA